MIKRFSYTPLHVSDNPAFREASAEELRVLLFVIEAGGIADTERIARAAGVSAPRVSSSLTLWQEAGVITEVTDAAGGSRDGFCRGGGYATRPDDNRGI